MPRASDVARSSIESRPGSFAVVEDCIDDVAGNDRFQKHPGQLNRRFAHLRRSSLQSGVTIGMHIHDEPANRVPRKARHQTRAPSSRQRYLEQAALDAHARWRRTDCRRDLCSRFSLASQFTNGFDYRRRKHATRHFNRTIRAVDTTVDCSVGSASLALMLIVRIGRNRNTATD
jgi:hypothetical protein